MFCMLLPPVCLAVQSHLRLRKVPPRRAESRRQCHSRASRTAALQQAYRELDRRTLAIIENDTAVTYTDVLKSAPNTPVRIETPATFDKRLQAC